MGGVENDIGRTHFHVFCDGPLLDGKTTAISIGIRNILEDQYPLINLSIILKSCLAHKRCLADGDTERKLADTQTDTLTLMRNSRSDLCMI